VRFACWPRPDLVLNPGLATGTPFSISSRSHSRMLGLGEGVRILRNRWDEHGDQPLRLSSRTRALHPAGQRGQCASGGAGWWLPGQ